MFVVLLVEDDQAQAQQMSRAIEALAVPRPVHVATGEEAVLWVGSRDRDLCVLDCDLPGIDGLETLARMHLRRPDLPVIFDLYRYQSLAVLEVAGGFLVRGLPDGGRRPEALEFSDRDIPRLLGSAVRVRGEGERRHGKSDLLPSGYEDFRRALGYRLDGCQAASVTVTEFEGFIAVGGVARAEQYATTAVTTLQWLLRRDEIASMLAEAFRRRVAAQSPQRSSFWRGRGRGQDAGAGPR